MNPQPSAEPFWAKPAIAIFTLVVFLSVLGVTLWLKNTEAFLLIVGSAISMAGTIVNYYFGSSSGSNQKDALLANSVPTPKSPT